VDFPSALASWLGPIFVWLLVIQVLGLLALPIVSLVVGKLDDGGYFTGKATALVLVTFLTWAIHHVIGYGFVTIVVAVIVLAAISGLVFWRYRPRINWALAAQAEAVFFLVFLAFLFVQMYHPYVEGGPILTLYTGERFMDNAFMNAINRADRLPPVDPWLGGERLTYYYYMGYLTGASLVKVTTIPMSIAYNLMTPTLAALTAMLAFGVGRNVSRRWLFGLLAVALVVFGGNLYNVPTIVDQATDSFGGFRGTVASYWDDYYWAPTRALFGPLLGAEHTGLGITEFPFFTFMWGSFHPNAISIPFQVLMVALVLAQVRLRPISLQAVREEPLAVTLRVAVLGIVLGYLFANQAWDYPTYVALTVLVLFLHGLRSGLFWQEAAAGALAPLVASLIFYAGYIVRFDPRATPGSLPWEFLRVTEYPSPVVNFLFIFGVFLFAFFGYLLLAHRPWQSLAHVFASRRPGLAVLSLGLLSWFVVAGFMTAGFIRFPLFFFLLPLVLLGLWALYGIMKQPSAQGNPESEEEPHHRSLVMVSLILAGAGAAAFAEVFFVSDYLEGGEFQRMNTVFKFYLQVWVLWALAAVYAVYAVWRLTFAWWKERRGGAALWVGRSAGAVWTVPMAGLILLSLLYAPLAINSWTRGLREEPTLDGTQYLREVRDEFHDDQLGCKVVAGEACAADLDAIEWLNDNVEGQPIVVEATNKRAPWGEGGGTDYTFYARVASLTGLPTLVGQVFHEFSWGNETDVTEPRIAAVVEIYETSDARRAAEIMRRYGAEYIFIGSLELKEFYGAGPQNGSEGNVESPGPAQALAGRLKFDGASDIFEKVYDRHGVAIYRLLS
jgi:YYY domain-containing protein